jgi:hypothetical protein
VDRSTGTHVAFLDDDDVWHPQRLEKQFEALRLHPDAIGCYTGGWYMDGDGDRIGSDWSARPTSSMDMLAGHGDFPRITTLLVTREAYLRVGGCDTGAEPSEDNDLILRLVAHGQLVGVDESLVGYRRHTGNVTSRGLAGRRASERVIRRQRNQARERGDAAVATLLDANLRHYRSVAADDNVGDLIESVRRRDWTYAGALARWGLGTVPLESAATTAQRVRSRLARSRRSTA